MEIGRVVINMFIKPGKPKYQWQIHQYENRMIWDLIRVGESQTIEAAKAIAFDVANFVCLNSTKTLIVEIADIDSDGRIYYDSWIFNHHLQPTVIITKP